MTLHRRGILFPRNPYGYLAGSTALVANISNQKPQHKDSFRAFSNMVVDSIGMETGKYVKNLCYIMDKDASTIPKQVAILKLLKKKASDNGATQTANAVTQVASWFYYNVENRAAASSAPSASPSASPSAPPAPYYEASFFEKYKMPIIGVAVGIGLILILTTK